MLHSVSSWAYGIYNAFISVSLFGKITTYSHSCSTSRQSDSLSTKANQLLWLIKNTENRLFPSFSPDLVFYGKIWLFYAQKWISLKNWVLCLTHWLLEILPKNAFLTDEVVLEQSWQERRLVWSVKIRRVRLTRCVFHYGPRDGMTWEQERTSRRFELAGQERWRRCSTEVCADL